MIESSHQLLQQPDYEKILEKQDFFPKIFLIPSQIKLHKDYGLMVIKRNQTHLDKFQQEEVLPITIDEQEIKTFNEIPGLNHHPAGHGLLSLFKRTPKRRIKLAICICVYSEPKHMLKATIKGIQQSYESFYQKAGIMPHQIIMIVIFDGIEKINNDKDQTQNMISFFNQIDIKNGFTYKPYGKTLQEYLKELQQKNFSDVEDNQEHISLFTEQELNSLKFKLFQYQYNEYIRIKQLLKDVRELKKLKQIKIDSLPSDVLKKYEQLSLKFFTQNNMWYQNQQEVQQYLATKKHIKIKLIYEALHQTELLCLRYIDSRQDKSILYPIRLEEDDLINLREVGDQDESLKEKSISNYNYMFLCVKHKNQGKLSSHMLFFQGFCKLFDPEYCILTDVGVKPQKDAIYKMWAHMEKNPKVGGVCGYMGLKLQNPSDELGYRDDGYDEKELSCLTTKCDWFFTVQRAQQFEYHFAHMLDKAFQSAFGYIHVLPGAFSGYRFKALKSVSYKGHEQHRIIQGSESQRYTYSKEQKSQQEQGETLMKRYLKTAISRDIQMSLEDSNMYLAEDRIMCLGIHALGYDLAYLPDAESCVDPVTSLTRLLGQRRRWMNGSWFAFEYVKAHSSQSSSFMFYLQMIYYSLVQRLQWIQISIFFITMNLTLITTTQDLILPLVSNFFLTTNNYSLSNYKLSIFNMQNIINSIPDVINFIYIILLFANLLYSALVNNNNSQFKSIYYLSSTVLGIYGLAVFGLLIMNILRIMVDVGNGIKEEEDFIIPLVYLRVMIIIVILGHALPILWTFSFKKYVQMLNSLLSYLYYAPTYINLIQIFAFARIDDLSWGTKGLDMAESDNIQREWQKKKYIFILKFVTTNIVLSYVLVKLSTYDYLKNILILTLTCLVTFLLLFRLTFALFYTIKYYLVRPWKTFSSTYINENILNGNRILNVLNNIQDKIKSIEKEKTKKKKQEEYKRIATVTSEILSKTLSTVNKKLRSKVAYHMVSNNIIPKKQLDPKRRLRNKRKVTLKKHLNIVEEMSNEQDQQNLPKNNPQLNNKPNSNSFKSNKQLGADQEEQKTNNYDILVPSMRNSKKTDIKARIQAIKGKRTKKLNEQLN